MQLARLRQPRFGAMLCAPVLSLAMFTLYCQLWAAFEGGVPVAVSLIWALINTASLALFAFPVWALRQRILKWIEEGHPANLVAAAGIIFGAAAGVVLLSTLVSTAVWGGGLDFTPLARRLLALLPFLAATAVAVTALIAAFRWRSASVAAGQIPSRPEGADRWIDFPEQPLLRLRPDDLAVIRTARNYCELDIAGRSILIRVTAKQLEQRLAPHGFVRAHRGAIVNLSRVRVVQPGRSGRLRLLLDDGSEVAVSRSQREIFTASLADTRRSPFDGRLAA